MVQQLPHLTTEHKLATLYRRAHDVMRNVDGLQPQEAFDELLKFMFFKQANEDAGPKLVFPSDVEMIAAEETRELARTIRRYFSKYVKSFNSWFQDLWKDSQFHLSDNALVSIAIIFATVEFSKVPFDARSTALKEFLTPEMRKGLGIYLTPDDVVKMMVEFVRPKADEAVYDPACGSGTFLIEMLKFREKNAGQKNASPAEVWGTDKNPRMLLLAELNMGHHTGVTFHRRVTDALFPTVGGNARWPSENCFDVIFTNPPFGVILDSRSFDLSDFKTCRTKKNGLVTRRPSEVVFVEKALDYLKPGGTLAIVLPKGIITNTTLDAARQTLDNLGYIYAAVLLPSETFATTGTQTSTCVLFIQKYRENENIKEPVEIAFARVSNVGHDSTGRVREESQLPDLPALLRDCLENHTSGSICGLLSPVAKNETFSKLGRLLSEKATSYETLRLGDVIEIVTNGRTPPRQSYTNNGLFVVKVGNLTGNGINWSARDRNFVKWEEKEKRNKKAGQFMLREGDILLTAAAHSPVYIAKKVDIVSEIPPWLGGEASFVSEIMLIRPNRALIDPYALLAYLRMPETTEHIQRLIRGQTAHIYASDLVNLPIPKSLLTPDKKLAELMQMLRQEAKLNAKLNRLAFEQQQAYERLGF